MALDPNTGMPMLSYTSGCASYPWAIYTCGFFNLAFLFLFVEWYVSTYKSPKTEGASSETKGMLTRASKDDDNTLSGHEKTC